MTKRIEVQYTVTLSVASQDVDDLVLRDNLRRAIQALLKDHYGHLTPVHAQTPIVERKTKDWEIVAQYRNK